MKAHILFIICILLLICSCSEKKTIDIKREEHKKQQKKLEQEYKDNTTKEFNCISVEQQKDYVMLNCPDIDNNITQVQTISIKRHKALECYSDKKYYEYFYCDALKLDKSILTADCGKKNSRLLKDSSIEMKLIVQR